MNDLVSLQPMPLQPITPTRILSFAPIKLLLPKLRVVGKVFIKANPLIAFDELERNKRRFIIFENEKVNMKNENLWELCHL